MPLSAPALILLLLLTATAAAAAPAPDAPATPALRTAGLPRHDGFLPYWWDARAGRLLVRPRPLGEEFLWGVSVARGAGTIDVSLDRGQLGDLALVHFARVGPRVLLVQRQLAHRSSDTTAAARRGVDESFPDAVVASFPIAAEARDSLVIDATDFVLHDAVALAGLQRLQPGAWRQDDLRSTLREPGCGAYPLNTELEAAITLTSEQASPAVAPVLPDGRSMTLVQHHTFLQLPPGGYTPLPADPRVGFFGVAFKDYGAPYAQRIEQHWIARWRMEGDGRGHVLRPLVYWLDGAIPEPERHVVRAAAAWWNDAFRLAGLDGAIEVRDLPAGASLLDARYSGIQWTHRDERAWSVGQSQVDPRTGEILHAVVLLDSHRRRTTDRMWRNLVPPTGTCDAAEAPDLAAEAAAPETPESTLVLARLAYLTAHEVGHTLGLEHDMAATTFGWGSVMDYLAPHIEERAGRLDLADAYPHAVGSYDRLAIAWGYGGRDSLGRDSLVRESLRTGVVFPLESDARWNEYDWGSDAARWLATCRRVRGVLLSRFGAAQLHPGEPVYALQERFSLAYLYHRFAILAAQRQLGGELVANALAGDGQTPRAPVAAAEQRRALDELVASLAPAELEVPARIEAVLLPPPDGFSRTREQMRGARGDAFDRTAAAATLAGLVIEPLLEPARAEALLRSAPGAPTFADVVARLIAATWGRAPARDVRLAALERAEQRIMLAALMKLAADPGAPDDARALVHAALRALRAQLRVRHATDALGEAHLRLAERELSTFLGNPAPAARVPAPEPPPGRPIGARR